MQLTGGKRAGLVERVAAGQRVTVTLQRSTTAHGRVELPPGASTDDVEVVLTHGRLRVTPTVSKHGGWRAAHLPQDSWWDVTARRKGEGSTDAHEAARKGIHAGDDTQIVLDLR